MGLTQEQTRLSALQAEKRTAVHVHPWTVLKLTDPAAYVSVMRQNAAKRTTTSTLRQKDRGQQQQQQQQRRKEYAPPGRSQSNHFDDLQSALINNVL